MRFNSNSWIFLIVSFFTGQWKYFLFSILPSLIAVSTGLLLTFQQIKLERKSV